VAVVTRAHSLRDVEQRTEQIGIKHGELQGIKGRIADNCLPGSQVGYTAVSVPWPKYAPTTLPASARYAGPSPLL